MIPTFKSGDLLYVRSLAMCKVRLGDIVVFQTPAGMVVHRIIKRKSGLLVTRGDANRLYDAPISANVLIGRVEAMERSNVRRSIYNGWPGWMLGQFRHLWQQHTWLTIRQIFGPLYRRLRDSQNMRRLLSKVFALRVEQVSLQTTQGPVVKYLHRGHVVARWWPKQQRFECRKPYDLFLSPPNERYSQ
jgi:hypothetical protein